MYESSNTAVLIYSIYIQRSMLSSKAWCWSAHFPWKVQLMILSWIWLALPNLISFAFVSTYHNYFRKSYQNMKLVLLWKPESHSPFFPTKTCSLVRMVNSIARWGEIFYLFVELVDCITNETCYYKYFDKYFFWWLHVW